MILVKDAATPRTTPTPGVASETPEALMRIGNPAASPRATWIRVLMVRFMCPVYLTSVLVFDLIKPVKTRGTAVKHLKFLDIWIGNTRQLLKAQADGMRLVYEVGITKYAVQHAPRSPRDPQPWVQVGGCEFRLKSTEIHAEEISAKIHAEKQS